MGSLRTLAAAALLAGLAIAAPVRAQDADTPLDKALQQVETLLATLKAQPGADPKTVAKLEEIAANLHKEKDARAGGGGGGGGGGAPPAPWTGGGVDAGIMARTEEAFFKGVDLKEDEKTLGKAVILEFVADYNVAKTHDDEKSKGVIRDHTEKRISKSFASKDANKMKDNLDGIIKFWEGRWGRGGR